MKLNTENFEQSSFTHKRIVFCLLWLRNKSYVPDSMKTSYKDLLFVTLEHYFSEQLDRVRTIVKSRLSLIKRKIKK